MKLLNYIFKISATVILLSILMTRFAQASEVSIAEFVKLSFEERVAICAKIVASNEIGDCASISPPHGEPVSASDLSAMASSCFSGQISDSKELGQCVRSKFDENNVPKNFPTSGHISKAYDICSKTVASNDIGSCTAALCTRLEE